VEADTTFANNWKLFTRWYMLNATSPSDSHHWRAHCYLLT
jgi:hypothetical protein